MRFFLFATLLAVLVSLTSAQTICEKYSATTTNATAQYNLIMAIVVRAAVGGTYTPTGGSPVYIQGLFNSSGPLYNLFTGTTQYRSGAPNYVTSASDQAALVSKLTNYFGALFGCQGLNYPQPSNVNMYSVHQNMGITYTMETYFNTQLANTLLSFGVSAADVATAGTVLGYFNRCGNPIGGSLGNGSSALTQVCGDSTTCPIATNSNYQGCINYYSYPTSSSGGNGATGKYAAGGLFVAAAAIVASLLL